ncbi:MAG: hypothetical protein Q7U38_09585, partial [Methylobacter sp.]|nr:hypothetical protein [Methylobacter sp.]
MAFLLINQFRSFIMSLTRSFPIVIRNGYDRLLFWLGCFLFWLGCFLPLRKKTVSRGAVVPSELSKDKLAVGVGSMITDLSRLEPFGLHGSSGVARMAVDVIGSRIKHFALLMFAVMFLSGEAMASSSTFHTFIDDYSGFQNAVGLNAVTYTENLSAAVNEKVVGSPSEPDEWNGFTVSTFGVGEPAWGYSKYCTNLSVCINWNASVPAVAGIYGSVDGQQNLGISFKPTRNTMAGFSFDFVDWNDEWQRSQFVILASDGSQTVVTGPTNPNGAAPQNFAVTLSKEDLDAGKYITEIRLVGFETNAEVVGFYNFRFLTNPTLEAVPSTDTHLMYKHGSSWSVSDNGRYIATNVADITSITVASVADNILMPAGSTIKVFGSDNVEKTTGNLASGDYVVVTAEDGTTTRKYLLSGIRPQVAAGGELTLVLNNEGKVYSFGNNDYFVFGQGIVDSGKLGRTITTEAPATQPSQIVVPQNKKIIAIAVGYHHSLLLDDEGKVYSFGSGAYGKLGHNNTDNKAQPTQIAGIENIIAISAGGNHSLLLGRDGKVYSFGWGTNGKLGHGDLHDKTVPTQIAAVGDINITAISAGNEHSLLLAEDGKVYAFGKGQYGRLGDGNADAHDVTVPTLVTTIENITGISGGDKHTLLLAKDGKAYGFGYNYYGQLGDGTTDNRLSPVQIATTVNNIASISAGYDHSSITSEDGKVYSFGYNDYGQLGHGNYNHLSTPTQIAGVNDKNIAVVSAGFFHTMLLSYNNQFYGFGANWDGQLGLCDDDERLVPTLLGSTECPFVDAIPPTTITLGAIGGVTAPVSGATPVTTVTETAQYTGTVSWSPAHNPFAASTVYTATITLTPKAGFTFDGVTADFFTVAGATSTNAENSGVVTAEFPATALPVMTGTVAITGDAKFGATLTAVPSLTNAGTPTYVWNRGGTP